MEPNDDFGGGCCRMAGQRNHPTVPGAFFRPFQRPQSNLGQPGRRGRVHCSAEPHLPRSFPCVPVRLRSVDRVERSIHWHPSAVAGPMVPAKAHHHDGVHRCRVVGRRPDFGPLLGVSAGADRLADYLGRIGRGSAGSGHTVGLLPVAERTRGNGARTRRWSW